MKSVLAVSLASAAVAQQSSFKLFSTNPSTGPSALETYHVGAAQNYLTLGGRDTSSGSSFYFNGSSLVLVDATNPGAFTGFVTVESGADAGVVQVGVGAESNSLTTFGQAGDLLSLEGSTSNFFSCLAVVSPGTGTNVSTVVYSTTGSRPTEGGEVIDVESCLAIEVNILAGGSNSTTTRSASFTRNSTATASLSRNATITHSLTRISSHAITNRTTINRTTVRPTNPVTTLCAHCYVTTVVCPACSNGVSTVTRSSAATDIKPTTAGKPTTITSVQTGATTVSPPKTTVSQANVAGKTAASSMFAFVMAIVALF